ncbi:hypothetical protein [Nocardia sp. NPDC020380]|uniref:hypothetical protein n=1 Tax=Nocardia sp. NPDC020380 TaxID=3364309 RepID=UPI003790379C
MTGRLNADPAAVQSAATIAGDIQARLTAIANAARQAVAPGKSAWGDDSFGSNFANGAKGFVTGADNLTSGTDNLGTSFGNLADGLSTSSQHLTGMEHGNTGSFG